MCFHSLFTLLFSEKGGNSYQFILQHPIICNSGYHSRNLSTKICMSSSVLCSIEINVSKNHIIYETD